MHCDEENNTAKIIIVNAINSMELLHFFQIFARISLLTHYDFMHKIYM